MKTKVEDVNIYAKTRSISLAYTVITPKRLTYVMVSFVLIIISNK